MANSPDSSVWRSLAVAFGDGLAFGVGVKLAQTGHPQPGALPPEAVALMERLGEMERRLQQMERLAVARPAAAQPAGPREGAGFDRQILEAVVNALDARLKEQAGQTERRLTELQAKMAIDLKELEKQDQSLASSWSSRVAAIQDSYTELAGEFRQSIQAECDALDERLMGVHAELCEALPRAVDAAVERKLASLRPAADNREREIAELRGQLADSDRRMTELLDGLAQVVRAVAERVPAPAAPPTVPPPGDPAPAATDSPGQSGDALLPGFALPAKPLLFWRVPLVSAVVAAGGALALLHYL